MSANSRQSGVGEAGDRTESVDIVAVEVGQVAEASETHNAGMQPVVSDVPESDLAPMPGWLLEQCCHKCGGMVDENRFRAIASDGVELGHL